MSLITESMNEFVADIQKKLVDRSRIKPEFSPVQDFAVFFKDRLAENRNYSPVKKFFHDHNGGRIRAFRKQGRHQDIRVDHGIENHFLLPFLLFAISALISLKDISCRPFAFA